MEERTVHSLKIWPEYYRAVLSGDKRFELRKNDRNFKAGDIVLLREWDSKTGVYTGAWSRIEIRYVLEQADGLCDGYCIFCWDRASQCISLTADNNAISASIKKKGEI